VRVVSPLETKAEKKSQFIDSEDLPPPKLFIFACLGSSRELPNGYSTGGSRAKITHTAIFVFVSEAVMQTFRETGAYLKGHFRLTSGLHSNEYLQCALVLQHPAIAERFGHELAAQLPACDVVVSPAIGGLIIGHEVARAKGVRFIFTERDNGTMTLRRGFSVKPGETAIVIEDVVTTGGSTREVIEALTAAGAKVLGAGSVIDRSGGRADLGVHRVALATLDVVTYQPDDCPLCKQGIPVVKPGSRAVASPSATQS
jgi:orotate phosphoribosyltransferase